MAENYLDEQWECYLCGKEATPEFIPGGWLGNYQPLCNLCADSIFFDTTSKFHDAMTFHYLLGEFL